MITAHGLKRSISCLSVNLRAGGGEGGGADVKMELQSTKLKETSIWASTWVVCVVRKGEEFTGAGYRCHVC